MNKYINYILLFLVGICFALAIYNVLFDKEDPVIVIHSDTHKIDSLQSIVDSLSSETVYLYKLVDSLKAEKTKIIIKHETDIKNFSDVHVVSDDSIARYIRQKINCY